jgi:signal transduction histidine kinase
MLYWFGVAVTFFFQALAGNNPMLIALCATTLLYPIFLSSETIPNGYFDSRLLKKYVLALSVSLAASLASYLLNLSTWVVLIFPVSILAAVHFKGAYSLWNENTQNLSRIYAVVLFLAGVHVIDFAFLRFVESFAPIGFSIGLFFACSLSAILPSFLIEKTLHKKVEEKSDNIEILFNILCHDIATPLTVLGYATQKLFQKTEYSEGEKEKLQKQIKNSYQGIDDILKHVKEMRSLNQESLGIEIRAVNISAIIQEVLETHKDWLDSKEIRVKINQEDQSAILEVEADPISLKNQVINNLITNAIKFSKRSSDIEVKLEKHESLVILKVKDYGSGMTEDQVNNLFSFKSNHSTTGTDGEKGTGHGMPILKRYLDMYGATIEVMSSPESPSYSEFILSFKGK